MLAPSPNCSPRRRCHPRAALAATALLFTRSRVVGPCLVDDFSLGGIRLTCDEPLRRGQRLSLLLDLPGWGSEAVAVEVCRHDREAAGERVFGVVFLGLPERLRISLEALVAEQLVANLPSIEFFDTEGGGCRKHLVLGEAPLLVSERDVRPL